MHDGCTTDARQRDGGWTAAGRRTVQRETDPLLRAQRGAPNDSGRRLPSPAAVRRDGGVGGPARHQGGDGDRHSCAGVFWTPKESPPRGARDGGPRCGPLCASLLHPCLLLVGSRSRADLQARRCGTNRRDRSGNPAISTETGGFASPAHAGFALISRHSCPEGAARARATDVANCIRRKHFGYTAPHGWLTLRRGLQYPARGARRATSDPFASRLMALI